MAEGRTQRRLAAILATDVVGYSRLIRSDEEGTLHDLKALRDELIGPQIAEHHGRIVKLMGDGMLVEFASVVDAMRAAVAIQRGVTQRNAEMPEDRRIALRIGVNLGDVIIDGEDIQGDGVNVAARLEGLADPGSVYVSAGVHDQVRDRLDLPFEDLGERAVKNIDRPIRVWRWRDEAVPSAATSGSAALPLPDKPSIAVLPFDNMSGDPEQAYFADGITEDIITEISKLPALFVISRNSTFTYKGKATKVQEVCRDLGVRYVLEGSVRKAGRRVRVTAQLIDGRSGGHLWAEHYDRGLDDIFAVQDDVTEKIVRALEVKLVDEAKAPPPRAETDNPEAYDCVLRGREQYRLFTKDGNAAAQRLYERAIALDPNYAAAHAGLAETHMHEFFVGSAAALDRAYELALKAKSLDPALPLVHEALGNVLLFKRQHEDAIAAAREWLTVEPGNADAYANLAGSLQFAGEHSQVPPLIEKAMRLNPFYPFYYPFYLGQAYFTMRRFDEAVDALKRSIGRNPDAMPPHIFLAACYGHLGEDAAARAELAEVRRISPGFSMAWLRTFMPYKRAADLDFLVDGLRQAGLTK